MYAKLKDGKLVDTITSNSVVLDGVTIWNPNRELMSKYGYYEVPQVTGLVASWYLVDGKLIPIYVKDPPKDIQPRVFSKFKFVATLMRVGLWEQVKSYIDESGLTDLYIAANEFKEDNIYFTQAAETLKHKFNITDEQLEDILSQSVVD